MLIVKDILDFLLQLFPSRIFHKKYQIDLGYLTESLCLIDSNCTSRFVSFTLLTYNVNNVAVHSSSRVHRILHAIQTSNADIILLQETNKDWKHHLEGVQNKFQHQFYHHPGLNDRSAGGLAVLSRYRIENAEILDTTKDVDGSVFPVMKCTVCIPADDCREIKLNIANIHLRPPVNLDGSAWFDTARLTEPIRLKEVQVLLQRSSRTLQDQKLPFDIIAGDFNESDNAKAIAFLKQLGYRDALEQHVPNHVETHTWPFWKLTLYKRLDHILWTNSRLIDSTNTVDRSKTTWKTTCVGCGVLSGYQNASDHQPVFSRFILETKST